MKVTGIISALIFAQVALGQVTDSSSTAVSNTPSGTKSASVTSSTPSSGHSSEASTKPVSATSTNATPTGSTGSNVSVDSLTESYTSDSDSNPFIPADISTGCSAFLNSLNSDPAISKCVTPLINALTTFISGSGSASAVPKTLSSLCSSNSCSASSMGAKLTEFKDACSDELTGANPNKMVIKQYDVWYSLIPFKSAICTKDTTTQAYCLLNIGAGSSSSSTTQNTAARRSNVVYANTHLVNTIRKRAQTVLVPNADTYRNSNLMYLFTSPDMTAPELCTPCTQQIVSKYIAFESATPYALGLSKSPLLGGQSQIWAAMQEKCTPEYMTQVTDIAGVVTAEQISGSAVTTTASYFTALAAAFAAAAALF
ncbi:unnamed protein product [Rhizoctonia solani]|uniref:DUF7729 domain-containing protein n=1 Tax=Rhizoctonia solani TaxID=456999 RepID=A0A8H2XS64_9AGAM|nr:unnamed protein product [Rhizoctonia solani]